MRHVIAKNLLRQQLLTQVMDTIGQEALSAKEIMSRTRLERHSVYYMLALLVKNGHLSITEKITKKGQGMLNHYQHTGIAFVAKTVADLEKEFPVGYFAKLRSDHRVDVDYNEKGPYDDMIAANPNLRKISAMFETRPELFKQEKRKTEHRGIPSTFGMYNMIPSGII